MTSPQERLQLDDGFLSRGDLGELGLPRRAVDAIFRACPVVAFPGYSPPDLVCCIVRANRGWRSARGLGQRPKLVTADT